MSINMLPCSVALGVVLTLELTLSAPEASPSALHQSILFQVPSFAAMVLYIRILATSEAVRADLQR